MISPQELAKVITSLDRPEDRGLFSQDVLVAYPHLEAEYSAVCPVRMDLSTMKAKALKGAYHPATDSALVGSARTSRARDAASAQILAAVLADVRLMTGNCKKFNQTVPALVEAAQSLEALAEATLRKAIVQVQMEAPTAAVDATPHPRRLTAQRAAVPPATPLEVSSPLPPSREALKAVILSWDREVDSHMFRDDVVVTHPQLAAAYTAVCPNRMWLTKMAQKASTGQYLPDRGANWQGTLSELVMKDVGLIVQNCVTFNGPDSVFGQMAKTFSEAVNASWAEFLSRYGGGKGTTTNNNTISSIAADSHLVGNGTNSKRPRSPLAEPAPPPPPPPPPQLVSPVVVPLPWQPSLHIPNSIRVAMVKDYVAQSQLSLRLRRTDSLAAGALVSVFVETLEARRQELSQNGYLNHEEKPHSVKQEAAASHVATEPVVVSSDDDHSVMNAVAALRLEAELPFVQHILSTVLDIFDANFTRALLYTREAIEADRYVSQQTGDGNTTERGRFHWRDHVSVIYFVRLLLHTPQLLTIVAAETLRRAAVTPQVPSKQSAAAVGTKSNTQCALDVRRVVVDDLVRRRVHQVVHVVEVFLCFLDAKHNGATLPLW